MSQDREFVRAVVGSLPDPSAEVKQYWIQHPLELQVALGMLKVGPSSKFEVFKTIKLGTGIKDANGFRKALTDAGMSVGDWANNIMNQPGFMVEGKETEVDLVVVSVAELGFSEGPRRDKIYERAQEFGLGLCPAEVGPQLRLQYKDQPNGEVLLIGMEPIAASDGNLNVFGVERDGSGRWLVSRYGYPVFVWSSFNRWVFVRPRK